MVYALSCTSPMLDETILNEAVLIFEGIADSGRALTTKENKALSRAGLVTKGGNLMDMMAYEFTVTRGWKGADEGNTVSVLRNTYWGADIVEEESYFVLIPEKTAGLNVAPLCGHTIPIEFAELQGFLKIMKEVLGQ